MKEGAALVAQAFTGRGPTHHVTVQTQTQDGPVGVLTLTHGALPHENVIEELNRRGIIDDTAAQRPPPELRIAARRQVRTGARHEDVGRPNAGKDTLHCSRGFISSQTTGIKEETDTTDHTIETRTVTIFKNWVNVITLPSSYTV